MPEQTLPDLKEMQKFIVDYPTELLDINRQLKLRKAISIYVLGKMGILQDYLEGELTAPAAEVTEETFTILYKLLKLIEERKGDDSVADFWIDLFGDPSDIRPQGQEAEGDEDG